MRGGWGREKRSFVDHALIGGRVQDFFWVTGGVGGGSDDDAGGVDGGVGEAEGGDDAVAATFGGAEVDEEDLIFGVFDDFGEGGATADEVGWGELAFEDGELEVVAEAAHEFEDFAEAAVVADVVADEVGLAHGVSGGGYEAGFPR